MNSKDNIQHKPVLPKDEFGNTRLNTDYIDILLLHVMTHSDWPKRYADMMKAYTLARDEGIVRTLGVSCHSFS